MNNQELYSVMVQINWNLKTQALTNMQIQWRPKSAGKWHPFQWEAGVRADVEGQNVARSTLGTNSSIPPKNWAHNSQIVAGRL